MNNLTERATSTIEQLLDVQAQLLVQLERLQAGQGEAWKHDCSALLTNDIELWINSCPHCGKPRPQPAVPEDITKDLNYLYWSAYHAGHHDTVEGCYRDVYAVDRFDYWEDRVSECIDGGDMPAVKALLSAGKEK